MAKRIVVIGGSASGPKAAAKARRMDEHAEITLIQKSKDLSMASCGYPYYVGGVFDDRNLLLCTPAGVVRTPGFYLNAKNITARVETEALSIDRKDRTVRVKDLKTGSEDTLPYDTLILATGGSPVMPKIPGIDLQGVTALNSIEDADYLRAICDDGETRNALIVGGGLIGMEVCEALSPCEINLTLVEKMPQILPFLDWEIARLAENHLRSKSLNVLLNKEVKAFIGEDGVLKAAELVDGTRIECELAVVAIGVRPNTKIAKDAGLDIGETGGIAVDRHMQTSDPNIYAVGDCVEVAHLITGQKVHAPFGDLANLEGRVAGQNAVLGNVASFPGTVQTGICKIFDYIVGTTGLSERKAKQAGMSDIETLVFAGVDKPNFMNGKPLVTKVVADRKTGRILGAQCVGTGEVSRQIAEWALSVQLRATVEDLLSADLPYAPPFSLAIDHFVAAVHCMENKLKGRLKGISAETLKQKLDAGEKPFLIDTRGPDEYKAIRLGIGETLIPLGTLRKRLAELPANKDAELICFCKISLRGYEAALILEGNGYTNVRVLEGGISAWPYAREK